MNFLPCRHFSALGLSALLLFAGRAPIAQAQRNAFTSATPHYARSRDYHVRHLKLVFVVDAPKHAATGVVTHYLAPLRDNLKTIVLDAGANLKIEGCKLDSVDVPFVHEKETLTISPPHPLARGKEVAVEVHYTMPGGITGGGANGAGGFKWIDPNPNDPSRRVGFWTQGETNTNHSWVPCYDYPDDKCTSETITTVPEGWEVIGNGAQGKTTTDSANHTRTFRWEMKQPHSTYLLSLVGGEMDVKQVTWAGIPVIYAVPKGSGGLIQGTFGNTPDMLQFFSDTLGVKYAWPKYAQCAVFDFPGGMENVSATTLGTFFADMRSGNYIESSLTSHELAHQWFGDLVTCKDWGDIWLNESFATFFEMLYEEHLRGKDAYDQERENYRQQYIFGADRGKHALSTKLYPNPDAMFDQAHTYAKGGLILHMLRRELGDTDFFRSLGRYLRTNAYRPVTTHDLESAIFDETGRNMEPFFDQWVFKPGHPYMDTTWTYDEAAKEVVFHVKQMQDTADGAPIYTFPLTVGLLSDQAATGAHVERQLVTLDKADQEFRLPAATKPNAVLIDPDHDLLRQLTELHWASEELPSILRYAPNNQDRRNALTRLDTDKNYTDDAKLQLYVEALRTETDENNASMILYKLSAAKKETYRALFRQESKSKQIARRAAALEGLSNLPVTPEDVATFHALALSDTEPYAVVEAALSGLGRLEVAAANLDVFKHQIDAHSLRDRLATRAISVLSRAKQEVTTPLLIEATTPPHDSQTRVRAIEALADVAPDSAPINAALMKVVMANDAPTAQVSAIRALQSRKVKDAAPTLRGLATSSPNAAVKRAAQSAADALEGK